MRKLLAGATTALLILPVLTSAQTVDELRAQAQALLIKIQQLQQQLGATPVANPGTGVVIDSSTCPQIGRVLYIGDTGDDVTRLQQFLARDPSIYPEAIISGYYGTLTEAAVQRWQARFNIVSSGTPATTGFGQAGPRTAAAMSLQCSTYGGGYGGGGNTGGTVGGYISVTPISGNAPLTVRVEATVNTVNSCTGATYIIEYGDGTNTSSIPVPGGNCQQMIQSFTHTYQNPGTYLVALSSGAHRTTATVVVTGAGTQPPSTGTSDSISASPTSGDAPLSVQFSGTMNGSRSCDGGVYTLVFGDGQSTQLSYPADGCQAYSFNITHEYSSAGTLTARLYRGTQTSSVSASVTITVSGSSVSDSLEVAPTSGQAPLSVSFSGVINGSKSCNGGTYTLSFGDGQTTALQYAASCQAFSYSVTHQYTSGGTFSANLYRGTQTSSPSDSAVITVSGSSVPYSIVSVTPAVGGNVYATGVQISYPACAAYSFSWGDNSTPTTVGVKTGCTGNTSTATLNHTYTQGGNYTVYLKDGSNVVKSTASVVISN